MRLRRIVDGGEPVRYAAARRTASAGPLLHSAVLLCGDPTMFIRLLLLLTVVPFVELLILLRLAERFTWPRTLAVVVLTGVLGAWLARREGLKVLARIKNDLEQGVAPANALVDGMLILVAGVVLVTPGVLTDACGFALLVPPIRRWVRKRLTEAFRKRVTLVHRGGQDPFIDVEPTNPPPGTEAPDDPVDR